MREVPLRNQWRHELLVYGGPDLRSAAEARWQWQTRTSLGISLPGERPRDEEFTEAFYYKRMFFSAFLASVGLTFAHRPR